MSSLLDSSRHSVSTGTTSLDLEAVGTVNPVALHSDSENMQEIQVGILRHL